MPRITSIPYVVHYRQIVSTDMLVETLASGKLAQAVANLITDELNARLLAHMAAVDVSQCEHYKEPCRQGCEGPAYCPIVKERGL